MRRSERIALIVVAAASAVFRAIAFLRYRFDSDEPQHLHVAWGWTAGLVQYRDVFDNHTPLFHMAAAPLLAALGERADILLHMRAAMLPLFAFVLAGTFVLARRLYSTRVGWWAAVLLSVFPPFFLKSLEFRNDNLWTALWVATLLVVIGRPVTAVRLFVAGLLLGTALAASFKTTLLVAAVVAAAALTRYASGDRRPLAGGALAAASGFVVVPAALLLFFARQNALGALFYCVFEFNRTLYDLRPFAWLPRLLFPIFAIVIVLAARKYRTADPPRLFLALTTVSLIAFVASFWAVISPRDFLPIMPICAVFFAAASVRSAHHAAVCGAFVLISFAAIFYYADGLENRTDEHITMMNQVLRLTRPGEPLMDLKGETIYRRRPYYYAFETVTRAQIAAGLIKDTVAEDMIAARCYVSQAIGPIFPPRARRFIERYYIDLGRLRAAGQWIAADGTFDIAVPGPYVVVSERGQARGTLDGRPYLGVRELAAGRHRFERATPDERLAVVWSKAIERGLSPFRLQDREF